MADINLADALLEKKSSRKKFLELFLEMVRTGEELIKLLRETDPSLFQSIRVPADELIERWESLLRKIIFLAFGNKRKSKQGGINNE